MNTHSVQPKRDQGSRVKSGRSVVETDAKITAEKVFLGLPTRPIKQGNIQSIPMKGFVEK